jgi:hypothetical protein
MFGIVDLLSHPGRQKNAQKTEQINKAHVLNSWMEGWKFFNFLSKIFTKACTWGFIKACVQIQIHQCLYPNWNLSKPLSGFRFTKAYIWIQIYHSLYPDSGSSNPVSRFRFIKAAFQYRFTKACIRTKVNFKTCIQIQIQ